jgi:hypothetical protein
VGLSTPTPVTGIVAYDSDRSLEAIATQVEELDSDCSDIRLRSDIVAVIGKGIIGPRAPLRGEFNRFQLTDDRKTLVELRRTGRHTLFRLYIQILREFNALTLQPLDLRSYDEMPRLIGRHRIGGKSRFVRVKLDGSNRRSTCQLNEKAIEEIVTNSTPVTLRRSFSK